MKGLTAIVLERACRIYMERAYPQGIGTVPPPKSSFYALDAARPIESMLVPPVCEPLLRRDGGVRGYALRLGSALHPHVKMQILDHDEDGCVFSVDTHDGISLDPSHPDAARWSELQAANRRLKEEIERAWEEAGLVTFNGLLRRELTHQSL